MRLVFVRHGETVGKSSIRFYGSTDVALDSEGLKQMRWAAFYLKDEIFNGVFVSPLSRCIEGARTIIGTRNLPLTMIEEFREIDFGRWEGLTLEEIKEKDPSIFIEWRKDMWNFNYPDGDKRADFLNRVRKGVEKVLDIAKEGTFLLVLHKGIIRTIFSYLLGKDFAPSAFSAELGSIHELEKSNGKWLIRKLNYTDHINQER